VKKVILAVVVIVVLIQLIPVQRSNPPVTQEIAAPAQVGQILQTACYNCHSNETEWPWYGYVAPVSWLVNHDVNEAREHFNLSTWDHYSAQERRDLIREMWEEVEEGVMPLWYYQILHPEARLSEQQMETLQRWAENTDAGEPA